MTELKFSLIWLHMKNPQKFEATRNNKLTHSITSNRLFRQCIIYPRRFRDRISSLDCSPTNTHFLNASMWQKNTTQITFYYLAKCFFWIIVPWTKVKKQQKNWVIKFCPRLFGKGEQQKNCASELCLREHRK